MCKIIILMVALIIVSDITAEFLSLINDQIDNRISEGNCNIKIISESHYYYNIAAA